MLFKSVISATVAAATVLAAPLESRWTTAVTPSALWRYNVKTGSISTTYHGEVSKSDSNEGNDMTTLMTFTYPEFSDGKQCQFAFSLDHSAGLHGSKKLDLFSSNSPAPGPTTTWGPGNQRNKHLGRLSVEIDALATWDEIDDTYLTEKTPCKPAGTVEGFELVGVNDNDYVAWDPATGSGLRILITAA